VEKGKKTTIVSTSGSEHVKDNITCVFGPKQVQTLMAIEQFSPSEEDCNELGLDSAKLDTKENLFKITGFISKPDHGMGRSSADRQFLYINKRPCELSKVSRLINEVYHMFNRHQYPFVMLDVSLARDGVDVNVTPDKRQVFVQKEKLLLATIKSSLKKMFDPSSASFDVNQKPLTQIKLSADSFLPRNSDSISSFENETLQQRESLWPGVKKDEKASKPHVSLISSGAAMEKGKFPSLSSFKRKFSSLDDDLDSKTKGPSCKQAKLTSIFTLEQKVSNQNCTGPTGSDSRHRYASTKDIEQSRSNNDEVIEVKDTADERNFVDDSSVGEFDNKGHTRECESGAMGSRTDERCQESSLEDIMRKNEQSDSKLMEANCKNKFGPTTDLVHKPILVIPKLSKSSRSKQDHVSNMLKDRKEIRINFSMDKLKTTVNTPMGEKTAGVEARLFRAKIAPDSNSSAEEELRKNISKDMFESMEILGQFNLGFVIAKLDSDLFIIDQHASDEKFNFEDQQRNTTIKSQRLIIPQKLELTAANEAILMDNLEIFKKNGFEFEIDHNAEAMKKIKLVSLPMSKNWTFGVEDIEELIFMLSDSPGVMCRPSRVRKMFASRACRMSIMVGTALDRAQMKKIVCHMGEIEHPWNCPHGRPTMRHLINLRMLPTLNLD